MVKQRRASSRIYCIKNAEGFLIEDTEGIEKIFVDHFKSTYKSTNTYNVESVMEQLHNLAIP